MSPLGDGADIIHLQIAFLRNELTGREGQASTISSLSFQEKNKKREGLGPSLTTNFGFASV